MTTPNDSADNCGSSRCSTCDGGGWMWPNLGVNMPAGAAWSIGRNPFTGADYYIQCETCNADCHKPHPDQARIDAAKQIHLNASASPWKHALLFDGSSLVDTWDANQRSPRKYRIRRP
jgi:hypothetical protein